MPKRDDITSVLVIGSGPIVIGQAAEFDYSGTQACRVLRAEGVRVILVNPNPATIMTDPDFADATYIEPITPEIIESIIVKERPDAVLPTLGGQTALNAAIALHDAGILDKHGVELIGAKVEAIRKGEDRQLFKDLVIEAGADVARSHVAKTLEEAKEFALDLGYPLVVRPSFTMGGLGSGFAYTEEDLVRIVTQGLHDSPTTEVLLEESILGWKEYELELMRDTADNTVVVCSIENVDPVGVHTGDSITVAPGAHAHRPRVPEAARHRHRHHPRRRRRHRRLQHPVRRRPGRRAHHRDRDEPARVALVGARLEGHRASRSRRSPRSSRSATASTRSRTTSRGSRRRASSRRSTTSSSRCPGSRSRSSPPPTRRSRPP